MITQTLMIEIANATLNSTANRSATRIEYIPCTHTMIEAASQ